MVLKSCYLQYFSLLCETQEKGLPEGRTFSAEILLKLVEHVAPSFHSSVEDKVIFAHGKWTWINMKDNTIIAAVHHLGKSLYFIFNSRSRKPAYRLGRVRGWEFIMWVRLFPSLGWLEWVSKIAAFPAILNKIIGMRS